MSTYLYIGLLITSGALVAVLLFFQDGTDDDIWWQ